MLSNRQIFPSDAALRSVYRHSDRLDGSFHWIEAGWENERTILLLHGLMAHSIAFRKVLAPLADDYRVILPDLPAHGRDSTFRSNRVEPTVDDLTEWLIELSHQIPVDNLHLMGHSVGALAALNAVQNRAAYRKHVDSLTLVSPGLNIDVPGWTPILLDWLPSAIAQMSVNEIGLRLFEPVQWRNSTLNKWEADSYLAPLKEKARLEYILKLVSDLTRTEFDIQGFEPLDLPTLIVWGENDHLLPIATGRQLVKQLGRASLVVVEDSGHCPMEDFPGEFVELVTDFIRDPSPSKLAQV
jgi:pimeloyl-ACP methyl ester carboxylesterase